MDQNPKPGNYINKKYRRDTEEIQRVISNDNSDIIAQKR